MGETKRENSSKTKAGEGTDALEGRGWDEIIKNGRKGGDRGVARLAFRRVKVIILFFLYICCRFTFCFFRFLGDTGQEVPTTN